MDINQSSPTKLTITERPFLQQLIPLAIAGAGIMLVIGSMREYGVQAWYRATYVIGGITAFWGIIYLLVGPKASRIDLDLKTGKMRVEHKQGIRIIVRRYLSLQHIQEIRIEQQLKKKGKPKYRLSARVDDTWVSLMHWVMRDLYDFEIAAKKMTAFLKRAQENDMR